MRQCSDKGEGEGALGFVAAGSQRFTVRRDGSPSSPPLVVAESPSYYSRLSSYTQTLSADTLVYLALRVTGRFICVKTYQFAETNGSIRHPASAPCYARSTVLLPSKHAALVLALGLLQAGHPRAREPPGRCPLEQQVTLRWLLRPFSPWFSRLVGCVRLARSPAHAKAGRATQRVQSHIALPHYTDRCALVVKIDHQHQSNPPLRLWPHTSCLLPSPSEPSNPGSSFDRFDICSHQPSPCRSMGQTNPSFLAALQ